MGSILEMVSGEGVKSEEGEGVSIVAM